MQNRSPLVEVEAGGCRRASVNAVKRRSALPVVPFCAKNVLFHFCMAPEARLICLL